MPDEFPPKPTLTEISHLFLSSVREKHTLGVPRPQRLAPGQPRPAPFPLSTPQGNESIDLSPEEFRRSLAEPSQPFQTIMDEPIRRTPPVSAILSAHLNGHQLEYAKTYARHLATLHGRVGLIEVDLSEFRVLSFEAGDDAAAIEIEECPIAESFDSRTMAEALDEMNWDVDHWLVLVPNPRTPEARALLKAVSHWVLLSTCDHDGVVSSYRLLKGLAESDRPHLSLAVLNAADESESERVHAKLAGVCQQFLHWELHPERAIRTTPDVFETVVVACRSTRDKAQMAAAPQWEVVANFIRNLQAEPSTATAAPTPNHNPQEVDPMHASLEEPFATRSAATDFNAAQPHAYQAPQVGPGPKLAGTGAATGFAASDRPDTSVDVIDLPSDAGPDAILAAILQQNRAEMIEVPIRAPMCDGARLAVTRDCHIVLLAVAREGLSELRAIGNAYRWISENRSLIAMAIPQFAINIHGTVRLRLLVDHADASASVLHQIMHAEHVTIQAYRKLRWGSKTGLFLEAA